MCKMRPLAIVLAPHLVRDLPAAIASDGARHTWASYHGTLERVVIDYAPAPTCSPPTSQRCSSMEPTITPLRDIRELAASARRAAARIKLQIVDGDHHLAVHRPEVVAAAIELHRVTR